jgi:hypothetical protein
MREGPLNPEKTTLHLTSGPDDTLRATTFGSLAESTIKTFEEFHVDGDYLRSKASEVTGCLRRAAENGYSAGDFGNLQQMKEAGEDLFNELIPASLRGKLEDAAGGDLVVAMDERLVGLPWELLHDGKGFFCRRYRMGRVVSTPPSSRRVEKRKLVPPVSLLSVADPEGNLPAALDEAAALRKTAIGLEGAVEAAFFTHRVRTADFLDGLRRFDVLHYAGHVTDDASLAFADGHCTAQQIRGRAGRHPFPSLVFLNGCRSSCGAFIMEQGQARTFDLASSFLLSGARHFIGSLWNVHDAVAARAGIRFFEAFLKGMTVGAAFQEAQDHLAATFGELSMVWAGYLLYGDPGYRIEGAPLAAERIFKGIEETEARKSTCLEALSASDASSRFTAAVALFQVGDRRGVSEIRDGLDVLVRLLRNPSPLARRQGALFLKIITGDPTMTVKALEAWWASEAAKKRLA